MASPRKCAQSSDAFDFVLSVDWHTAPATAVSVSTAGSPGGTRGGPWREGPSPGFTRATKKGWLCTLRPVKGALATRRADRNGAVGRSGRLGGRRGLPRGHRACRLSCLFGGGRGC